MFKKIKRIFELVTLIVGTIIGAGFISGAELLHFFPTKGYIYYLCFASLFIFGGFYLLYQSGRRYGGFAGVLQKVFKKFATAVHICLLLSSVILCGSMLAGFVSSLQLFFGLQKFLPLYSFLLLVAIFLLAFNGVKAILHLNAILVPFMIVLVLCFFKLPTSWQTVQMPTWSVVLNIILFVFFNLFLSAPVLCDLGDKHRQEELQENLSYPKTEKRYIDATVDLSIDEYVLNVSQNATLSTMEYATLKDGASRPLNSFVGATCSSVWQKKQANQKLLQNRVQGKRQNTILLAILIATLIIFFTAATILENIIRCHGATEQTLPFLYTINGNLAKILFAMSAIGGILTTLFSAYYTLHTSVNTIPNALIYRLIFAICAYLLSILGLKYIIQFCYPIIGGIGILFFIVLFMDRVLQKKFKNSEQHS